ncbi:integrase [Flavobacterium sp. W4I14]|nr:integrase [Flavobacterium sp. W4I14]
MVATNRNLMRQPKQSQLIHTWGDYEFYLNTPKELTGGNKPFVYFYQLNPKTNKSERIRRYIPKFDGNKKKIAQSAKQIIDELLALLKSGWNPITNLQIEKEINYSSNLIECLDFWIKKREDAHANKAIGFSALKNNKILVMHYKSYLETSKNPVLKIQNITKVHIKEFLDQKAFERNWGKVTYNTYLVDLGTFFNYLIDMRIIKENPCSNVTKKNTRWDSSRFKVFEKDELLEISKILNSDKHFLGLNVATKLLFKYNIRPIEITRLQIKDINFEKDLLIIPSNKTKNGNEATFQLDKETKTLLSEMTTGLNRDYFVFGGWNKPTPTQVCSEFFGQNWRALRKKYNLSPHLKLYALKHTSNYYDIENGASYEEIRQRNRHSNLQVTTLYIKERLFKNIIKSSNSGLF